MPVDDRTGRRGPFVRQLAALCAVTALTVGCSSSHQRPAAPTSHAGSPTSGPTATPASSQATDAAGSARCRPPSHLKLIDQGHGEVGLVAMGNCSVATIMNTGGPATVVTFLTVSSGGVSSRSYETPLSRPAAWVAYGGGVAVGGTTGGRARVVLLRGGHRISAVGLPGGRVTGLSTSHGHLVVATTNQRSVTLLNPRLQRVGGIPSSLAGASLSSSPHTPLVLARLLDGSVRAGPPAAPREIAGTEQCGDPWVVASASGPLVSCNKLVAGAPSAAWIFGPDRNNTWRRLFAASRGEIGRLVAARGRCALGVLARTGERSLLVGHDEHWTEQRLSGIDTDFGYEPAVSPEGQVLWLGGSGPLYQVTMPAC